MNLTPRETANAMMLASANRHSDITYDLLQYLSEPTPPHIRHVITHVNHWIRTRHLIRLTLPAL